MDFPDVGVSDLTEACYALIHDGFIRPRGVRRVKLSRGDVSSWIRHPDPWGRGPRYRLTHVGGLAWERECRANWKKFVSGFSDHMTCDKQGALERCRTIFEGADAERVALNALAFRGDGFRCTSQKWKELTPWKATYWKVLPKGHRLACWFERVPYDPLPAKFAWFVRDLDMWYDYPPRFVEPSHPAPARSCDHLRS